MFDQTPMSEVKPITIAENVEGEEDDEDNVLLIWKLKKIAPNVSSNPDSVRD